MSHYYWNDWYAGWGWFLWFAVVFLFFSSVGTWGYAYRTYRRLPPDSKDALTILNERYARGEIKSDEYLKMKREIAFDPVQVAPLKTKSGATEPRAFESRNL